MNKKISELPLTFSAENNDILPIVQDEETRKIEFLSLKNKIIEDIDSKLPNFIIDSNGHLFAIYPD